MSKRDLEQRFDDIVAFSELEQFIDSQVKHYSSGMYVRLGFAIAVNVDPEILLVDEVLAVGDEAFQRKCLERVREFQREGRTIVFVTHAADLVRQICDRAVVLDHGKLVARGLPARRCGRSVSTCARRRRARPRGSRPCSMIGSASPTCDFDHPGLPDRTYLEPGEAMSVPWSFEVDAPVDDPVFTFTIYDAEGRLLHGSGTTSANHRHRPPADAGEVVYAFDQIPLLDGEYACTLWVTSSDGEFIYDWHEQRYRFSVRDPSRGFGSLDFPVHIWVDRRAVADHTAGR